MGKVVFGSRAQKRTSIGPTEELTVTDRLIEMAVLGECRILSATETAGCFSLCFVAFLKSFSSSETHTDTAEIFPNQCKQSTWVLRQLTIDGAPFHTT